MTALATVSDLGVRLGLDLTGNDRAAAILDDVSASVRGYTGRTFASTSGTVTVDVCCGKATLPDGPVTAVSDVEVDGDAVDFTWTSGRTVTVDTGLTSVDITYTYGWAAVPEDIVAVVCQIAGRAYGANAQNASNTSESLGDWSIGMGAAGAAGPLGMLNDERAVLDRYRAKPAAPIQQNAWAW